MQSHPAQQSTTKRDVIGIHPQGCALILANVPLLFCIFGIRFRWDSQFFLGGTLAFKDLLYLGSFYKYLGKVSFWP